MFSRFTLCISCGILALSLSALPAFAHHGWAGNFDEEFELTGTVQTPLSLAGPHATMKITVDGKVWDLTLAPPAGTARSGLKEGIIPVGARFTMASSWFMLCQPSLRTGTPLYPAIPSRVTRAGFPMTMVLAGTSRVTTAPAATNAS